MAEKPPRAAPRRAPEVLVTGEFQRWSSGLDSERRAKVNAMTRRIAAGGPTLGRPHVDVIHESRVRTALDTADERLSEAELRGDLYLSALGHYVEALGGRLEVRAVFSDDGIVVRRYPD